MLLEYKMWWILKKIKKMGGSGIYLAHFQQKSYLWSTLPFICFIIETLFHKPALQLFQFHVWQLLLRYENTWRSWLSGPLVLLRCPSAKTHYGAPPRFELPREDRTHLEEDEVAPFILLISSRFICLENILEGRIISVSVWKRLPKQICPHLRISQALKFSHLN